LRQYFHRARCFPKDQCHPRVLSSQMAQWGLHRRSDLFQKDQSVQSDLWGP